MGRRLAWMSSMSAAVVRIAPVMRIAAFLCIEARQFTVCMLLFPSFRFFLVHLCGFKKTSAAYKILGMAIEIYVSRMHSLEIPVPM